VPAIASSSAWRSAASSAWRPTIGARCGAGDGRPVPARRPGRAGCDVEGGVLGEDRRLEVAQATAGLDAELVDERAAGVGDGPQGVGLLAGAVAGGGEQRPEPLAQRVLGDQLGELAHDGGVAAELEVGGEPVLQGGQPALVEAAGEPGGLEPVAHLEHGRAPPQPGGFDEQLPGRARVAGVERGTAPVGQVLEPVHVELGVVDDEAVAGRLPLDRGAHLAEHAAEARHVALERAGRRGRGLVAPHGVEQRVGGDDPAGLGREQGEHDPRLRTTDLQRTPVVADDLERPEQPDGQIEPPPPAPADPVVGRTLGAAGRRRRSGPCKGL
jgi:hypothetical protein